MFKIIEVEWDIKSEDIQKVTLIKEQPNVYEVDYESKYGHHWKELDESVFALFKKEFPEHCITIDNAVRTLSTDPCDWLDDILKDL